MLRTLQALEAGPAGFREDNVPLLAHCAQVSSGCSDEQVEVLGSRISRVRTYRQNGGDSDAIETSWTEFEWMHPEDAPCERCGVPRVIGEQRRPVYESKSGFDQKALLRLARQFTNSQRLEEGTVVQAAKATPTSPLDLLGYKLAEGSITIEEFRERREALEETSNGSEAEVATSAENEPLPRGVRRHGAGYQGYKRVDGRQVQKSFATVEEAVAWRDTPTQEQAS